MAGRNRHLLQSMSPERTSGNTPQTFAIKQEEIDSENSNLDWTTENRSKQCMSEVDYGVRDAKIALKQDGDFSANEADTSQGNRQVNSSITSGKFPKQSALSEDFDFIRSCLNVVLNVHSEKRHELVQAMSSKLKYIEAITTGKNTTKILVVRPEKPSSSKTNLFKLQSNSAINSSGSDEEASSSDAPQDGSKNESDQEMMKKVMKSSYAVTSATVGLVTKAVDGSVKCNVCDRIITKAKGLCTACSSYVSRMRWKCRESGLPLPSCYHKNFSGGASCQSCRLRKYLLLSKRAPQTPTQRRWKVQRSKPKAPKRRRRTKKRRGEQHKCMICEKMSPWIKGWRCSACFIFYTRLIGRYEAGEELPECSHDGFFAGVGCKGCRRIRLQREAAHREPELAARLPEIPSKNTAHADKDDE